MWRETTALFLQMIYFSYFVLFQNRWLKVWKLIWTSPQIRRLCSRCKSNSLNINLSIVTIHNDQSEKTIRYNARMRTRCKYTWKANCRKSKITHVTSSGLGSISLGNGWIQSLWFSFSILKSSQKLTVSFSGNDSPIPFVSLLKVRIFGIGQRSWRWVVLKLWARHRIFGPS